MEQTANTKEERREEQQIVENASARDRKETEAAKAEKEMRARAEQLKIAREVALDGKGKMKLKTPVRSNDKEYMELSYDFAAVTGMEYVQAMDSDPSASGNYGISTKQAITLFAIAAAKKTDQVDKQDILRDLYISDAIKAEELAKLFFNVASAEANQRISKM